MKQSSWGCTISIQISLCLIVYVSLHLGHPFFFSSKNGDNAGALDLHFISVSGGFRPIHQQTRLLRLMERVAETYKAKFVVTTSPLGEEDPLLQNATRMSSSLKLPWYNAKKGSGYVREHIEMPFGGSLDVVFVDIGSIQQEALSGAWNGSMISQMKELIRILKASDGDWRIVVGSDQISAYTKEPEEATGVTRTLYQIMTKYGVNLYINEKGCTSGVSDKSFSCIMVPNPSENIGSTNDTKSLREMEDGFLLHRVSFSEFVTYTINTSGQVIDTRLLVRVPGQLLEGETGNCKPVAINFLNRALLPEGLDPAAKWCRRRYLSGGSRADDLKIFDDESLFESDDDSFNHLLLLHHHHHLFLSSSLTTLLFIGFNSSSSSSTCY